jgi:hypothetical protein
VPGLEGTRGADAAMACEAADVSERRNAEADGVDDEVTAAGGTVMAERFAAAAC